MQVLVLIVQNTSSFEDPASQMGVTFLPWSAPVYTATFSVRCS